MRPVAVLVAVALVAAVVAALLGVRAVWTAEPVAPTAAVPDGMHPASVQELVLPAAPRAPGAPAASTADPAPEVPSAAGRSPAAAVTAYLDARAAGDIAGSYALLSGAARRTYESPAVWLDALPDLPPPGQSRVVDSSTTGNRGTVVVDVRRRPLLDPFVGFVPARAIEVYEAQRSTAGWRIDPDPIRRTARLASDRTAAADVAAWLEQVAACDGAGAVARQVSPDLLGDDSLPGVLCRQRSTLLPGPAQDLTGDPSTAPFLAAYGPEMGSWARLVPVERAFQGRAELLLVAVAPLGSSWRVFGIVTAAGG